MKKIHRSEFIMKLSESFWGIGLVNVFAAIIPFIAVKIFGSTLYGEYTYYFSIATVLSILSKIGLDTSLMYYIPKTGYRYISSSFLIVVIMSIFIGSIYVFIENPFMSYVPLLMLLSIHALFLSIHRASGKIKQYYLVSAFIQMGLTIILLVIFNLLNIQMGILLAVTLGYLSADMVLLVYNKGHFRKLDYTKELIVYSLPLLINSGMDFIVNEIDVIMLKQYFDASSVGVYSIAAKISTLPVYILYIFNTVFAPKISQLYHAGKEQELKRIYTVSSRYLALVSLVIVIVVVILNQWILGFFGREFLGAGNVILYRGIGKVVNCSVGSVWYMLSMTGRAKLNMIGTSSAAIINVVLNLILIPCMGMNGAAIASMIAGSIVSLLGYILVKKFFDVKVFGVF